MSLESQDGPWVLYVDPDGELCEQVTGAFADNGIRAESVDDIDAANAVLAERRPSCLISEYELPSGSGITLLEDVRRSYDGLPFVVFTDSGSEQIASEAVSAGVTEYIPKQPLSDQTPHLIQRVRDHLETTANEIVTEPLKDKAMDHAPVGITIADMRLPDEPLVYVNDAFERLTGYSVEETVGRNCRFLQGEESDSEAIATMREAIESDDSTAVELRNYTKDGEEFWNRVEIAPIQSSGDEVTHYVGYQTDVSARKEAEIAAHERADALEQKQQELESVLARIEGLLQSVSVRVINARTSDELEQQVCGALVEAAGYERAWMSERAPNGNTVEPAPTTATDGDNESILNPTPALVETALKQGVVAFDGTTPPEPTGIATLPDSSELPAIESVSSWLGTVDEARRAVVPVIYRGTTYGVIGIQASDDHTFDRHEAVVLSTLGRIVGTALNTVRTQSLAQGDTATELELSLGEGASFVGLTSTVDCQLEHVGTVPPGEGPGLKLFFEVTDESPTAVAEAAVSQDSIDEATVVRTADDESGGLVSLSLLDSPLVDALTDYSGTITDATAADGTGTVTVQLSQDTNPRTFVEELEDCIPAVSLDAYHEEKRPQLTNQEFVADVNGRLTNRQRDALQTAYVSGFFGMPRQANGDELADAMGITRATFHQHLRTAERKLLDAFYDD
jgi:PAS domain S-box-containing protein